MPSETKIGEDVQSMDRQPSSEDERLRNDICSAAANGDLEKLQRLVEQDGCSVSDPDEKGHYALQWAALKNRTDAAHYIIQHGGDVNVTDHDGQTALHWSAVRGATQVADVLLQEGALLNVADMYGYRTTHVAAQYGQTAFLYHIVLKWKADPNFPDNYGRGPLHWAAYKGFVDCICLLLFLDANRGQQDNEGYTPLHWAAITGNLEACTLLVLNSNSENLIVTENTGCTPAHLASDRNHRHVALFLKNSRRQFRLQKVCKLTCAPVLWCKILVLLATYIHYVILATNLPKSTVAVSLFAWFGVLLAIYGLVFIYRCSSKDPGYIRMNVHNSNNMKDDWQEPLLKIEINNPTLQAGNWSQLCAKCKIVRPLRAKHCSICDRCVEQFDHHCPWVSNCIGKKNKREFFFFLVLEVSAMLVTGGVTLTILLTIPVATSSFGAWIKYAGTHHVGAVSFLMADCLLLIGVFVMTVVHAKQISHNITTNEKANVMRYTYLKGPDGRFRNPYDHGVKKNSCDFLIQGSVEELGHSHSEDTRIGRNSNLPNGDSNSQICEGHDHVVLNVNANS